MSVQLALIAVLSAGAVWKSSDLVLGRRGYGPLLPWIVAIFALLGIGNVLSLPGPLNWVNESLFLGAGRLMFNAVIIAGLCAVVCLGVATTGHRRRVPYEIAGCAAVIAALLFVTISIPADHRGHSLASHDLADPHVTAFYLLGNAYFIYAYCTAAYTIWHLSHHGPTASRLGLRVLAVGLGGLGITCLVRLLWILEPALRESRSGRMINVWNFAAANYATIALCVGICLPAIAQTIGAMRLKHLRRQQLSGLYPLWDRLGRAFPELLFGDGELHQGPGRRRRSRQQSTRWRLYRNYVECRDGLLRLSPYLAAVAESRGLDVETLCAEGVADLVDPALALKPNSEAEDDPLVARRIAVTAGAGFDDDVDTLIQMARSLPAHPASTPTVAV